MRNRADVLDLAVLGRLADGPQHGYELRKSLMTTLGVFRTLSFGSLYPRLRALEERGLLTSSSTSAGDPGALPHALAGRRSRIVYELTATGKEHLAESLAAWDPTAWDDDAFDVRFSMFAVTDHTTRLRILEGRRARVLERREASRAAQAKNRERRDAYTLELQRHGLDLLERELGWLDGLIAAERTGAGPGHPAQHGPPGQHGLSAQQGFAAQHGARDTTDVRPAASSPSTDPSGTAR